MSQSKLNIRFRPSAMRGRRKGDYARAAEPSANHGAYHFGEEARHILVIRRRGQGRRKQHARNFAKNGLYSVQHRWPDPREEGHQWNGGCSAALCQISEE